MKAKLTFDLDDPDDRMAHLRCVNSLDMAIAIFEIQYNLKNKVRHFQGFSFDDKTADKIFEFINEVLGDIDIDKLII